MVHMVVKDEVIFGRKLRLEREIRVSTLENSFEIHDAVRKTGMLKFLSPGEKKEYCVKVRMTESCE